MYRSRDIVKKCAVPTGCFVEKILLQFHKKSFILKLQEHTCSFISYTLHSQYDSNIYFKTAQGRIYIYLQVCYIKNENGMFFLACPVHERRKYGKTGQNYDALSVRSGTFC